MTLGDSPIAKREGRAIIAVLFSVLLASCSSTTDPNIQLGAPGYNSTAAIGQDATASLEADTDETPAGTDAQTTAATGTDENNAELPVEVAYLPASKPISESLAAQTQPVAAETPEPDQQTASQAVQSAGTEAATSPQAQPADAPAATATAEMNNPVYVTAGDPPSEKPAAPKKKGLLSSLFGSSSANANPASAPIKSSLVATAAKPGQQKAAKPIVQLASASSDHKPVALASLGNDNALPGVRQTALFEIKRKSGMDDDSDVDLHEEDFGAVQVASAAGLARLAPNGLLTQTADVDVSCLKPSLVRVLKTVEAHYGKKAVITSGYRNQARNQRARGAKNSLHMYCAAADVQIPGVSKWELANYVRSMPGRGGVGTYCHTESVHIDVGPERDWNWRCRRRK